MSGRVINRRAFLSRAARAGAGLLSLAAFPPEADTLERLRGSQRERPFAIGRVATRLIYVYQTPAFTSERVGSRPRDTLISLLEEFRSPAGPQHNPKWYRVNGGFIHSGQVQRIEYHLPNPPLTSIPEHGIYGMLTVPYVRAYYQPRGGGWEPLYRLYYDSLHWIREVIEHRDGTVLYRLFDPKNDSEYYVPAAALRPVLPEEYAPTARDVPADQKRIVVDTTAQTLKAYEGEKLVLDTLIASGVPSPGDLPEGELPTDTPKGSFRITLKMPSRHMGDGRLTSSLEAYELPGVPWTMAFHKDGYALHGSYWHDNFGRRMSHGCVNMRNSDALWLFRWSDPVYEPVDWYARGLGTLVIIT